MSHDDALNPIPPTWRFDHHGLHVFHVLLDALVLGEIIVRNLPRGYANFGDQAHRALSGAYLQTCEAAARCGADRVARFRTARAEACEAAACLEALARLGLVTGDKADAVLALLWRACAMLTKLMRVRR